MNNCIFCEIIKNKIPSYKIWEDDQFLAFLDINPIQPGHTLLIPKKHVNYLFDLDKSLYQNLFQIAKQLSKPLQQAVNSKRVGLIVEGFAMPHAHLHLIPITVAGQLSRSGQPVLQAELKSMQQKIQNVIIN